MSDDNLGTTLAISRSNEPLEDLTRVVEACSQHDRGLERLADAVRDTIGSSLPYQRFVDACRTIEATTGTGGPVPILGKPRQPRWAWSVGVVALAVVLLVVANTVNGASGGGRVPEARLFTKSRRWI